MDKRLIQYGLVIAGMVAVMACSGGTPGGGSPQSPDTGSGGETTVSGSTNDDTDAPPSDVANPPTVTPSAGTAVCGNSKKESDEQCDDSNTVSGDGCSSICKTESCGDGIVHSSLGEECDGTNLNNSTCATFGFSQGSLSCNSSCKLVSTCSNPAPSPVCGNAKTESGEQCDDGNAVSGDGCSSICKTESCGDGVVQSGLGEECDGSNLNGNSCTTFGYSVGNVTCSGTCKLVKTGCSAVCGNGTKETGEGCDDGNTLSWDGCTSTCQVEASPTISDNFTTSTNASWNTKAPHGVMTFAATDSLASDQKIAKLTFSGGQTNAAGTSNATQISTTSLLGFGMYRARFNFAKCAAGEDLTNGIFTYSYGGTNGLPKDSNGNSITDNNEVDIELWCGNAKKLYMTTWTDYDYDSTTDTETFRKYTRVIDLATGKAYETPTGKENTYDVDYSTVKETIPEMALPSFATDNVYYEMGFEWKSTSLRYFIVLNGKEITLWNYTNSTYIPQNKAFMMFNVWYPAWSGKAYPASDQSLKVDWFKYWAN